MNRIRLRPTTLLTRSAAVAVASVLALSACGTNEPDTAEEADSSEQEQTEETDSAPLEQETEEAEEAAATEDATTSGEGTEVKVGTEFTDDETGDVITIVSAVRNNPTEYYEASDNPDGEMVYLEVKVVPGKEYGGTISASDFYLDDGGDEVNYAASADDEVEEAGYEYFDSAPRREGEHTGYVPIYISETADSLKGAYVRPEAKVIGEDKKVPEFRSEFDVPAS
ncbi:hypothetical protein [Brevibacterium linens]|uniref:DUF4352 domain-containing protein n=2 Tax=Brevibacterium linens TaxID=1703 RepID=A0A2H1K342_BRELN|nr:hypothetical protein [Brevibacterium linens]KAB1942293.1 hypothetical protein F8227_17265 [Brevibacterium linens ATCC 9172]SMX82181.1 hypothetical protein BLIN9172_01740 [Brevibacterium linens ATCC 9172]SMX94175.1 hypothetical protein BLIN101_02946 [Brevibacterium linens]